MYNETGYGGVPDELPSNYGYADSAPTTVHTNADTAKSLFEPVANYPIAVSTDGRGNVGGAQTHSQPYGSSQYRGKMRVVPNPPQPQPLRSRPVGAPQFQASGRHTTPSNTVAMRARPTEYSVPAGVPKPIRYEDLPENLDEDDDALGSDYGLTAEEKAAKKKAKEEQKASARAAKAQKKSDSAALKAADKAKLRDWQQAAQLALRFDAARGKWYRDVKISGTSEVTEVTTAKGTSSDRPLLVKGAKGASVKKAQQLLAEKGFGAGSDGSFTETMRKQVIAFQNAVGVEADGKIGKDTWEALDPTSVETSSEGKAASGQVVRQYQDGAVAIIKGPVPSGAAKGAVLSPSKFPKVVSAIKAEVEENYNAFPLTSLTPPPANWDFKLGKMKPGFTLDIAKLQKEITSAAGKFKPSGKAAAAPEAMPTSEGNEVSTTTEAAGPNWMLIGGIAAGVIVVGGLLWAFSSGGAPAKPAQAGG